MDSSKRVCPAVEPVYASKYTCSVNLKHEANLELRKHLPHQVGFEGVLFGLTSNATNGRFGWIGSNWESFGCPKEFELLFP